MTADRRDRSPAVEARLDEIRKRACKQDGSWAYNSVWEELAAALTREERLREALAGCKRSHYYSEDCWYSCPKAEGGCCNDSEPKDECTCGADEFNARIDAVLTDGAARVAAEERQS